MKIKDINKWLSGYIEKNNISNKKLYKKSGITVATLYYIRNNKRFIRLDTLNVLAKALDIEIDVRIKIKNKIDNTLKRKNI